MDNNSEIVIYQSQNGLIHLDVQYADGTVWLTQQQIADLFGVQVPAISKHLSNIFKEGELDRNSVISILENTAKDGKVYRTQFYNSTVNMADLRCIRQTQFTTVSSYWMTKQYTSLGLHLKMQVRSCSHSRN